MMPPYVPGNERWKLNVIFTSGELVSKMTLYAILRDTQKLIDSKWKK